MPTLSRSDLPVTTRRRLLTVAGFAALGTLVLNATRKAEPAVAAAAPMLRPDAMGTSAGRCAFCGSAAHSTLSPACAEGSAPRRALQREARRRSAVRGEAAR
jgi:hypothetical protein